MKRSKLGLLFGGRNRNRERVTEKERNEEREKLTEKRERERRASSSLPWRPSMA